MVEALRPAKGRRKTYLECSGPDESVVAQVATDIGRDDFAIYAITRYKIDILARRGLVAFRIPS